MVPFVDTWIDAYGGRLPLMGGHRLLSNAIPHLPYHGKRLLRWVGEPFLAKIRNNIGTEEACSCACVMSMMNSLQ